MLRKLVQTNLIKQLSTTDQKWEIIKCSKFESCLIKSVGTSSCSICGNICNSCLDSLYLTRYIKAAKVTASSLVHWWYPKKKFKIGKLEKCHREIVNFSKKVPVFFDLIRRSIFEHQTSNSDFFCTFFITLHIPVYNNLISNFNVQRIITEKSTICVNSLLESL